jgi:O-succinylbenzoic acid--CoA ligase
MRDLPSYQRHASPEKTALINAETGDEWTYREFDRSVEKTASRLWSMGVRPGDQLGILLDATPDFARLVHATWRIGVIFVPLNTRLAETELAEQMGRIDLAALICEGAYATRASRVGPELLSRSLSELRSEPLAEFSPQNPSLDSPRTMVFTSGTTGEPKAVILSGTNLVTSAVASAFRLGILPDDQWYDPLPGYHMGGLAPIIRSALYGTTVVLASEFDATQALSHLRTYSVTGTSLVPTMLDRILDAGDLPDSLRFVLTGGAPTSTGLIERCESRRIPIHPTYGMTETASQISTAAPKEAFCHPEQSGRPLAFTRVRAVVNGEALPPGEPGELVVSGPTVTKGYYGDAETTERAFGLHGYHTGDLGVVERNGSIRVIGRLDDVIITGGENVHPEEVSGVLTEHPAVETAAVVGVPDPEWGERIGALLVGEVEESALRELLANRLADYKHPKTIEFTDSLPRTASGTVDRAAVRNRLSGRAGE